MNNKLKLQGFWEVEHWRNGVLLSKDAHNNAVTELGLNAIMDTMFETVAKEAAWYLGLIDNASFELLEQSDTMLSHDGWTEFTDYSELTRPQWTPDPAVSGLSINTLAVDFNITANGIVQGGFVTNDNLIGGTAGLLWGTASFAQEIVVETGDVIKALYGIQAG